MTIGMIFLTLFLNCMLTIFPNKEMLSIIGIVPNPNTSIYIAPLAEFPLTIAPANAI